METVLPSVQVLPHYECQRQRLITFLGLKSEIYRTNFLSPIDKNVFVYYNMNREDLSSHHNRIV